VTAEGDLVDFEETAGMVDNEKIGVQTEEEEIGVETGSRDRRSDRSRD
jgi:hypothetical protein